MARYYDYEDWYTRYRRTAPRKVKGGIRARSLYGRIGSTWWSKRWLDLLESFGLGSRLERGRRYARMGQVVEITLSKCKVEAKVQGSRQKPYDILIKVKPLPDSKWGDVIRSMGSRALFAAKLLAGEMPEKIEDAFKSCGAALFPSRKEINTDCSCPDYENPCKHIAAIYYILAEEFDKDPFMIFKLRGRTKEETVESLRKVRAVRDVQQAAGEVIDQPREAVKDAMKGNLGQELKIPPLEDCVDSFWATRKPLQQLSISVKAPHVNAAVIKRLGEPQFWREAEDFTKLMERIYEMVTKGTLEIAFREEEEESKKTPTKYTRRYIRRGK